MDEQDEGIDMEPTSPVDNTHYERLDDVFPDDEDSSPTSDQFDDYDAPPPEFDDEQLNPNVNDLFPTTDIRRQDEAEALAEAPGRIPPLSARRYYSEEGNKPAVRFGSVGSDASSANSSEGRSTSSKGSDLADDIGLLFEKGTKPEIANDLASRRGRYRPAGLELDGNGGGEVKEQVVSSAKFKKALRAYVEDEEALQALEAEFDRLNDAKNNVATTAWQLYKSKAKDYDGLHNDYYAGAGEERRRVRLENEYRAKEARKARKERVVSMALNREAMMIGGGQNSGDWRIGENGALLSPDDLDGSEGGGSTDQEGGDDEEEEGKHQGREFYSDDEEDPRDVDTRDVRPTTGSSNSSDNIGDRRTRIALDSPMKKATQALGLGDENVSKTGLADLLRGIGAHSPGFGQVSNAGNLPSTAGLSSAGHRTRESIWSVDKPLPAIPAEETQRPLVEMLVLLRLLPVKIKLIEQISSKMGTSFSAGSRPGTSSSTTSGTSINTREAIDQICERASDVLEYAEQHNASMELQGRCAFYMGLAEFLRSRVRTGADSDGDGGEGLAMALFHFENAVNMCGEEFEEGEWAKEWVWWVGRKMEYVEDEQEMVESSGEEDGSEVEEKERVGTGEGVMDKFMSFLRGGGKKKGDRGTDGSREGHAKQGFDDELHGGMRQMVGEEHSLSRKRQNAPALGIDTTAGQLPPGEARNTILSPSEGIFVSPERFADGFTRSPTDPTVYGMRIGSTTYSPDAGPSPMTRVPTEAEEEESARPSRPAPLAPKRYKIMNPDSPSTEGSASDRNPSLPAPVTTKSPAVSPGGSGLMANLARRLSSTLAVSPTSDTSAHSPKLPTSPEAPDPRAEIDNENDNDNDSGDRRQSIAQRRRSSGVQRLSSIFRAATASSTAQDSIVEAEEGNSPSFQTSFERDSGKSRASGVAKSPLSSPNGIGDRKGAG